MRAAATAAAVVALAIAAGSSTTRAGPMVDAEWTGDGWPIEAGSCQQQGRGQGFTVGMAGQLVAVDLRLRAENLTAAPVALELRELVDGLPVGAVVGSTEFATQDAGHDWTWTRLDFAADDVDVLPGDRLGVLVFPAGTSTGLEWAYTLHEAGEGYALGTALESPLGSGGEWFARDLESCHFRTLVAAGFVPGDLTGDGVVDGADVGPFTAALLAGPFDPAADVNGDGSVDGRDVGPFAGLLAGASGAGVLLIPEPDAVGLVALAALVGVLLGCWR